MKSYTGRYPAARPRRLRQSDWIRRLTREHRLSSDDLIWAIVVHDGPDDEIPIAAMPGVMRLSVSRAGAAAKRAHKLGIPAIAVFPHIDAAKKDVAGKEALNPNGLVCNAVRAIKDASPDIGVMVDVALDPFTDHGHDGLLKDGRIVNDETVKVLVEQALVQVQAGADIVAPSDMMDGRIGAIRAGLDREGFADTLIMSYAAKYASAFYGPYREAIGSGKLGGGPVEEPRRQAHLPNGFRQWRRSPARGRHGYRRRRGPLIGEAGLALSRHRPAREDDVRDADLCVPGFRRIRDDQGRSRTMAGSTRSAPSWKR